MMKNVYCYVTEQNGIFKELVRTHMHMSLYMHVSIASKPFS